jgi:FixJ family two-component response regulator
MSGLPLISVIDDDDAVRESLQALIRSAGFTAQGFASAEEFLHSDTLSQTHCLILDVRLPAMNGMDLKRHLTPSRREIPIIFITAHGDEAARIRALREGALEYLFKPFNDEALLNAIQSSLVTS